MLSRPARRLSLQKPLALLIGTALGASGFSRAHATPLQDKQGTWTLQGENDAVTTLKGTSDQYYTSGLRINWTSGTDNLPGPFALIDPLVQTLFPEGGERFRSPFFFMGLLVFPTEVRSRVSSVARLF